VIVLNRPMRRGILAVGCLIGELLSHGSATVSVPPNYRNWPRPFASKDNAAATSRTDRRDDTIPKEKSCNAFVTGCNAIVTQALSYCARQKNVPDRLSGEPEAESADGEPTCLKHLSQCPASIAVSS
jgi:hypothetical protein